jgi:hypothetical protein
LQTANDNFFDDQQMIKWPKKGLLDKASVPNSRDIHKRKIQPFQYTHTHTEISYDIANDYIKYLFSENIIIQKDICLLFPLATFPQNSAKLFLLYLK